MKTATSLITAFFTVLAMQAAHAQPVLIEQVQPRPMRTPMVHPVDGEALTPARPVKKIRVKNKDELMKIIREESQAANAPGKPGRATPVSGLSQDPSTLEKEKALQGVQQQGAQQQDDMPPQE